ncbi:hypothetical protein [Kineosporia babensis]|uniref:Uncharacterized protein n=1 Tax=Kineosporia babensis TaxID=499548 RepID=A0A9X1NH04_9ACTN|nr:hypothetical protein [Kineosporia babensis]MCD5313339.1 hypothetical protein [Kineosporia babensis]
MSLILTAVVAGESKAETNTMLGAVEDDFTSLYSVLRERLAGRPGALQALEEYVNQPESDREELIAGLTQAGATHDPQVLRTAFKVMQRIDPEGSANGNYELTRV